MPDEGEEVQGPSLDEMHQANKSPLAEWDKKYRGAADAETKSNLEGLIQSLNERNNPDFDWSKFLETIPAMKPEKAFAEGHVDAAFKIFNALAEAEAQGGTEGELNFLKDLTVDKAKLAEVLSKEPLKATHYREHQAQRGQSGPIGNTEDIPLIKNSQPETFPPISAPSAPDQSNS